MCYGGVQFAICSKSFQHSAAAQTNLSVYYTLFYILAEHRRSFKKTNLKVFAQFEPQLFLSCCFFLSLIIYFGTVIKVLLQIFENTCGTVLIFFSAYSVLLTAEKPARKPT